MDVYGAGPWWQGRPQDQGRAGKSRQREERVEVERIRARLTLRDGKDLNEGGGESSKRRTQSPGMAERADLEIACTMGASTWGAPFSLSLSQ